MRNKNSTGALMLVTPIGETQQVAIPVNQAFSVYETKDGSRVFVKYDSYKQELEVQETLNEIFAQQNTDQKPLNMVLVNDVYNDRRAIYFTHHLKQISSVNGVSQITFQKNYRDVTASESLATLYNYQASAPLGMMFVERASDGQEFIEFTSQIATIVPAFDGTGALVGSIINFEPTRLPLTVVQTPTQLHNSF